MHVLSWASTGSWSFKVQHSSAASVWADLSTARVFTAASSRYTRIELTGTIKRYVKVVCTAKTGGNPTVGIAYGRY